MPLDGEPVAITRELESSNIEHRTWVEISRCYSDTGDAIQALLSTIKDLGLEHKYVGYERNSYFFSQPINKTVSILICTLVKVICWIATAL